MAVVCDYLSYSQYNPSNPNDFLASVPSWYNYAKGSIIAAKAKTKSAKEQAELNRLVAEIDRRLAVRTRK